MVSSTMEKVPDLLGYLVMQEDGAILSSGGELENKENKANVIYNLIQMTNSVQPGYIPKGSCQRISIVYEDFSYIICLSNKRIHVVMRKNTGLTGVSTGGTLASIEPTMYNSDQMALL